MCYFQLFGVDTCDEGYRCHEGQCIPDNGKDMIYITRNLSIKIISEIHIQI